MCPNKSYPPPRKLIGPPKFLYKELQGNDFNIINSSRNAEPHSHAFIEVVYFYSGKGIHEIDGKTFSIHSGDIFCINPNVLHSYTTYKENNAPIQVYNLLFNPEFLGLPNDTLNFVTDYYRMFFDAEFESDNKNYLMMRGDIKHDMLSIYKLIQEEFALKGAGYQAVIYSLLNTLLVKLYRANFINNSPVVLPEDTKNLISDAQKFIDEHFSEQLLLADIAKKYNYSVQYFNKLFNRQTGMSFKQYIQKTRITAAAELLKNTDESIDEICGKVGYYDLKHFYITFNKYIGIPPAKYRAYIKKQDNLFTNK